MARARQEEICTDQERRELIGFLNEFRRQIEPPAEIPIQCFDSRWLELGGMPSPWMGWIDATKEFCSVDSRFRAIGGSQCVEWIRRQQSDKWWIQIEVEVLKLKNPWLVSTEEIEIVRHPIRDQRTRPELDRIEQKSKPKPKPDGKLPLILRRHREMRDEDYRPRFLPTKECNETRFRLEKCLASWIKWVELDLTNICEIPIENLEAKTIALDIESDEWIPSREKNKKILGLPVKTLREYRSESKGGRKMPDKKFGIDHDGRIWRRQGTLTSMVYYLASSIPEKR